MTYNIGTGTGGSNGVVTFANLQMNNPGSNDVLVASVGNGLVPTNIANCMVWLDTSDTNTITGTASVTAIGDKSGNGNNFGTLIGSTGSIAYTNTMNGRKVVTYAGGGSTGKVLHNTSYRNTGTNVTWFALWRHSSVTPNNFETPLSSSDGSHSDYSQTASFAPSATTPGGSFSVSPQQERTSVIDLFTSPIAIGTTAHTLAGLFDGANSFLYLDGALSQTHSASSGNFNIQLLSLGQRLDVAGTSSTVSSWQGDIAELIVFNAALSSADQARVQSYLNDKWTNAITGTASTPFNVISVPATQLTYSNAPANPTIAGAPLGGAGGIVVQMLDVNGIPATNSAGTNITIALASGTGTLLGTLTQATAANGQATFTNVSLTTSGTYTLSASATGLASVTNSAFNINPAAASQFVFVVDPTDTPSGFAFSPCSQSRHRTSSATTSPPIISRSPWASPPAARP